MLNHQTSVYLQFLPGLNVILYVNVCSIFYENTTLGILDSSLTFLSALLISFDFFLNYYLQPGNCQVSDELASLTTHLCLCNRSNGHSAQMYAFESYHLIKNLRDYIG